MRHGSLFNGIGGFQLAAHWMGWENVFSCEIDEYCNKVTKRHFPNCIQHGDIKQTDFTIYRGGCDILTGGDPCQPSSVAGLQKGKEDERYLWLEYKRCIIESQPKVIVNENVTGTITNGILDEKIRDLEIIGYSWWTPFIIPASATGAGHKRDRVWLVAHSECQGLQRFNAERENIQLHKGQAHPVNSYADVSKRGDGIERYSQYLRSGNGVCRGVDKLRVKALGNAIVPQIAFEIFKAIEATII